MPRPRFATADAALRQNLLDAARDEFASKPYEAASLNRILLAAGVSKGSFYYYFDDKTDLAATLFLELAKPMATIGEFERPSSPAAFWAEMHRISYARLKDIESMRTEYECVMRIASAIATDEALRDRVMPMFAPGRAKMMELLQAGVDVGALRSDLPMPALMQLLQDVKMSLFKSLYPADHVLSEAELRSFTDLVIDLAKRISASPKGGTP
ncbi:MAG: TetR/AcrR family transcriptional regulator [Myxococcaceae bacterium]|nr:TetR/AcrR family transcriptional regulator [Myxococcaceae bacterium]